ncbi:hypothetical protein Bca4012_006707 [Brassica carinata]
MASFHLPLHFPGYKSLFFVYGLIKISKTQNLFSFSDRLHDGTQKLFDFQRPRSLQDDRRLLRACKAKPEVHRFLCHGDET